MTRTDHFALAAKLRASPGKWFKIGTYSSYRSAQVTAASINYATKPAYATGGFTARIRNDGTEVWAKYIGPARYIGPGVVGQ